MSASSKYRTEGTASSTRTGRRRKTPKTIDPGEFFACNLCHKTTLHHYSIQRHLFMIHHIEKNIAEIHYEVRRLPSPPPPALGGIPNDMGEDGPIGLEQEPPVHRSNKRSTNCRDVGCQAPCLNCSRLKKRAQELEKLLASVSRIAETTKADLEKL